MASGTGRRSTARSEQPGQAAVEIEDVWVMLLSTIRYSLGRSSYMPGLCRDFYNRYARYLTDSQRKQIGEEIEEWLRRTIDGRINDGPAAIGLNVESWRALVNDIKRGPDAITALGAIKTGEAK